MHGGRSGRLQAPRRCGKKMSMKQALAMRVHEAGLDRSGGAAGHAGTITRPVLRRRGDKPHNNNYPEKKQPGTGPGLLIAIKSGAAYARHSGLQACLSCKNLLSA
jgi:hypothetical protein